MFVLLITLGGWLWGAAKINNTVENLTRQQDKMSIIMDGFLTKLSAVDTRVTVLEVMEKLGRQH